MGEFVIKKWKCDRCGVVNDARPYGSGRAHYEVMASVDYETAGGAVIKWKEMCGKCDAEVGAEIESMRQSAKRAAQAGAA